MAEIVICEFMDQAVVDETAQTRDVIYDPELVDNPDGLKRVLKGAKGLVVRNRTRVNAGLLAAAPHLKVVGRLGVGLDNIDLAECKERGITVCPATGANDVAVAEYVLCSVLTLIRGAYGARTHMLAGEWPRHRLMGNEIGDKTLGLIGFGGIARQTAVRARALGMNILAFDPYLSATDPCWKSAVRCEALAGLLEESDVVSLHVPLTKSTHHLINTETIGLMKDGAIVINAARGGVVDEAALVEALKSEKLGGAALDVFETEPLTEEAASSFTSIANIILTPHIAGVTIESNIRVSRLTMQNVCRVLEE
ncbi:MAG: 3-phosphoglycerate dehydrogenase [Desulfobacterales bacterium]|nr:MAG: 3-phosphoglycerate dehydrogenase [Desulfobacterales bacterium]